MTMNQKLAALGAGLLIVGYFTVKRKGSGDVTLGIPTVTGSGSEDLGGQGYYSPRNDQTGESEMDRLIRISNELGETATRDGRTGLVSPGDDYNGFID